MEDVSAVLVREILLPLAHSWEFACGRRSSLSWRLRRGE